MIVPITVRGMLATYWIALDKWINSHAVCWYFQTSQFIVSNIGCTIDIQLLFLIRDFYGFLFLKSFFFCFSMYLHSERKNRRPQIISSPFRIRPLRQFATFENKKKKMSRSANPLFFARFEFMGSERGLFGAACCSANKTLLSGSLVSESCWLRMRAICFECSSHRFQTAQR